jgi:hypothetical protein
MNASATNADKQETRSRTRGKTLFILGLIAFILWALYDIWHLGLLSAVFDLRLWLLGIPLYFLYRKYKRSVTMTSTPPTKGNEPVDERKPEKPVASRWARLGIFMGIALTSAIIGSYVFFKGNSTTAADLTKQFTKVSLQIGLAAWGLSEVVAGRWLTLKRTLIGAIALYGIGFILVAVFLGKPLATKLEELDEEQTQLERRFAESATGKTLLQPESFASPQVAATSLTEFEQYADAKKRLNEQEEALLLKPDDDPALRIHLTECLEATRLATSTTEELYRFAADPSHHVHVENGVVIVSDPVGYNKRIDAVNDAMEKYKLTCTAFAESAKKVQ